MSSGSPPGRGRGGGGGGGVEGEEGPAASSSSAASSSRPRSSRGRGRRRTGDPSSSSSRPRSADAVWPEHFVESVAASVSIDAARSAGRLAAARAVVVIFQVCSTWRAISASEYLWEMLCRCIWSRRRLSSPSWHEEYVRLHRTAVNFLLQRSAYSRVLPAHLAPAAPSRYSSCRRLAISDRYLAAGFFDGSVRLFDLPDGRLLTTYHPDPHRARLGHYSQAVAGIFILDDDEPHLRLTFATQDGDVYIAVLDDASAPPRRAFEGNLFLHGTLVDFAGDARWWVGLFAGVPSNSWHVWDAVSEQLVYVGGSFMDGDAVYGWHMLTELPRSEIGRVRMARPGFAVGCSRWSMEFVDLDAADPAAVLNDAVLSRMVPVVVESVDACEGRVLTVDRRHEAKVSELPSLEEACRFDTYRVVQRHEVGEGNMVACMNWGFVVVFTPRGVRVWNAATGEFLHHLREQIGAASAAIASERYVAAWGINSGLHLWDFGEV